MPKPPRSRCEFRFAGVDTKVPCIGDTVKVTQGEYAGHVFVVQTTKGNVYRTDQQIVVEEPETGALIWYYAWNLVILDR